MLSYYQINEEEYQFLEGNCVSVVIPVGFEGNLSAYAIDGAGNKGEVTKSSKIICEDEIPEILIRASEGLGKWYSKPCLIQIDISEHGVASGIKQVICSVNNKVVQNREYERGEKETENVTISVDKLSEIVVEVSDWAGNYTKKREKILFDNENPQLILEGAEDYCIAANDKTLTCKAIDNQRIVSVGGTIIWNDANGNRIEKRIESWEKDGAQYFAKENLTESGKYKVYLEAVDQAGNRSEKEMQIIMDKENPLIHKIEELEGKYVPFFEWKYDISEIVEDFTTYTYRINMDGRICEQNKKYTQEGKHSLELIAEDLAGNTSSMEVGFFIDHTPPEIQIDCSKEEKKLDIVLGEEHDFLDAVFINEKKQQIGENERKFSHIFEKSGSYEVLVFASDVGVDTFGHKMLTGSGKYLENLIKEKLGVKVRSVELNVSQRCSSSCLSKTDLDEADHSGAFAVNAALNGETGKMISFVRTNTSPYELSFSTADVNIICNQEKAVPLSWITKDGSDVTDEFIRYAAPLIQGSVDVPTENGLPLFAFRK